MSNATILISAINGFVATDIALAFLNAGYRVRGTVRSQEKADAWLALPAFKDHTDSGKLKVVIVKDITPDDAFVGEPLDGVDYFIHTPAQLPDWRPGVTQYPQCKKVIVLGSISGAVDFSVPKHDAPVNGASWNPRDFEYGKNAPHPLFSYSTSKKLADAAAWKYMEDTKPHFALVNMLPGFIYGPSHGHDRFGVHNSSQQWLAGPLFRQDWNFKTASGGPTLVDLRDLSIAFIKAVERDEANGQRLVLSGMKKYVVYRILICECVMDGGFEANEIFLVEVVS
uniref:Putative flavonol reductase/cinnamoyl-CoA reductase n=1 Tax=Flammulina velutipes TaxID=38945 RepID=G8A540_FLAVE|nr:putative flavonol reductase/cinnamoyl-CoA reductase [Flammulina velutipes]